MERALLWDPPVVGRITEEHLSEAEKTFPGIHLMYQGLDVKPATFLQLVWIYESALARGEGYFASAGVLRS